VHDQFVQTKIKAEQFEFYIKQQQVEQEKLERRISKLKEKQNDEMDNIAQQLMQDG
jgi:hypothetical protein